MLLGGGLTASLAGVKHWSAHIASAADAAVQAAEASFGVEGAHEAALARAQAVVMATDGFTAQVHTLSLTRMLLYGAVRPVMRGERLLNAIAA